MNPTDAELRSVLRKARNIAVVGASNNVNTYSNEVTGFLIDAGYNIYPVNPNETEVLGLPCYPSLEAVPVKPDIVDVFRRSEHAAGIVDDAAKMVPVTVWLQEGVRSQDATNLAQKHGIQLVSSMCIMKTYWRLFN